MKRLYQAALDWEWVQDYARTGVPIVLDLYHGTSADPENFRFDPALIGTKTDEGWLGRGFYFTPHLDVAEVYGRHVLCVRVTLDNPFVFPDNANPLRFINTLFGKYEDKLVKSKKFTAWVKEQGHDGVVSTSLLHQVCVFDPQSIEILEAVDAREPKFEPSPDPWDKIREEVLNTTRLAVRLPGASVGPLYRFKGAFYREAAKLTMWHGTATGQDNEILRRILKQGLVADPRKRRYEAPEQLELTQGEGGWAEFYENIDRQREVEFVTYGGTYLSSDLSTALGYAQGAAHDFGGSWVMVVAQIETRSPQVAIDEDQFISTVNLSLSDLKRKYEDVIERTGREDYTTDTDFFLALQTEQVQLTDADVYEVVDKLLREMTNKAGPLTVAPADLMRYAGYLKKLILLKAEFDAATDSFADSPTAGVRNATEVAANFREVVNEFTRKIGKLADPAEHGKRNVRSLEAVGYRGANRILGVIQLNPKTGAGVVYYGANDPAVQQTLGAIDEILGIGVDYQDATKQQRQGDLDTYVDLLVRAVLYAADQQLGEASARFGDLSAEEIQNTSAEYLSEATGLSPDNIEAVLQQYGEEIAEEIGDDLPVDDVDLDAWGHRLDVYDTALKTARDAIRCMEAHGLEDLIDSDMFDVMGDYLANGLYDVIDDYYPDQQEELGACWGDSENSDLYYAVGRITQEVYYKVVADAVAEWIRDNADDVVEELTEQRAASVRTALTPQQKQLKKDYLLEQQRASDRIPTLEEVLRDYANMIDERADGLIEMFEDEAPDEEEAMELARAYVVRELEDRYDDSMISVGGQLDGADCWRAVNLVPSIDPMQHRNLGIYWAYDRYGADAYDAGPGATHIYRARVDLENVDKGGTVWANLYPSIGEEEYEVRFYQGAPIFVYDVTLPNGTVLEINDWRRC